MDKKEYFFDKPGNRKMVNISLYLFIALLTVADLFIHKHPHFPWEGIPSFYSFYGFISSVVLVLIAKYILQPLLNREENYYD